MNRQTIASVKSKEKLRHPQPDYYMKYVYALLFLIFNGLNPHLAAQTPKLHYTEENGKLVLTFDGAAHLSQLPLKCMNKEFPYKPWYVIVDSSMATKPRYIHPAFYGCYDWHSSVHGHWLLVALLKKYPNLPDAENIKAKLKANLTRENILKEAEIFNGNNQSFERIYGWAWLLQLQNELLTWNDPLGKVLSENVKPLSQLLAKAWIPFLSKLSHPVREPEHYNLAFGLCLTWDYATTANDTTLLNAIAKTSRDFYLNDTDCPINYEPGGYDFLSPCLEEADLMRRVLPKKEFQKWFATFLPQLLKKPEKVLQPCAVKDPTDGKLGHLYGVNLSRAWCLNGIADNLDPKYAEPLRKLARKHIAYSFKHVASGDYMGDHWLATYGFYATR